MLEKRSEYWYGDDHADIQAELVRFGKCGDYQVHHCADATCQCGGRVFRLAIDELEGVAVRECVECDHAHPIGDSEEYLDEADLEYCACPCGNEEFEVSAGVSLFEESDDVCWFFVGCRCTKCGLIACYGHWKNEFSGYEQLLSRV